MLSLRSRTGWLVATSLALVFAAAPGWAQQNRRIERQQQRAEARRQGRGHAGDWLRRYKDLPPDQQQQALENDPQFKNLPPERQQQLRERLQRFSNLPPEKQQRILNRMETWEHLTPEQKQQARGLFQQLRQLPPERRQKLQTAIADLRTMPPAQRQQVIDSPRFKSQFSPEERGLLSGISQLPLAPADNGQNEAAPEEP